MTFFLALCFFFQQQRRLDLLTITNSGKSLTSYDFTFTHSAPLHLNTTPPVT